MAERCNVLIVGGGVVGSALAYALAERGVAGIRVVDLDLAGLYASSELNAGGARATWWQPVNIASCLATLDFFRDHAVEFAFREHGYLWLYEDAALFARAREKRALQNRMGLGVEILDPREVTGRFPLVDRGVESLVGATFSPRDGLVNPNTVRAFYRREATALGVAFHDRDYVTGVRTQRVSGPAGSLRRVQAVDCVVLERGRGDAASERIRQVLTTHRIPQEAVLREESVACDVVVNCLGAWSPVFSAKLGVPVATEPVRRQIALVDVHREDRAPGVDPEAMGMVVDASGIYLHPEGAFFLAGYSDPAEPPGYDFDYDGDAFFEGEIWPRLAARSSSFERCGHVRGWAGLYAVTPDRSGIAGPVAGFANLFEAHSFTGRGVMQSFGIAGAMAGLIANGHFDGVDLAPLARSRFADTERWVREDLHI